MHEEAGTAVAEVVTGEAVVLDVPRARFPSRLLARGVDLLIQGVLLFALFLIVGLVISNNGANAATAGAIALTVTIAIIVGARRAAGGGIAWSAPARASTDQPAGAATEGEAPGHQSPTRGVGGFVPPA
jgi:hypothetical protein